MDPTDRKLRLTHFVEEVSIFFEREGLPRMYGRILGHLMVCTPAHQSSAELADALSASRGAISTATRALLQAELIQRKPVPGSRALYFEMRPGTMDNLMHAATTRIRQGREMIDRGMELVAHLPASEQDRLAELRDVFSFMEAAYPKLIDEWDAVRTRKKSSSARGGPR